MKVTIREGIRVKITDSIKDIVNYYKYYSRRKGEAVTPMFFDKKAKEFVFPRNIGKFRSLVGDFEVTEDNRIKDKNLEKPFTLQDSYNLYPFQQDIVKQIEKHLDSEEASCILKAPPRTGKSYMLPAIVKHFNKRVLILVDRTNLVEQMFNEFTHNTKEGDIQILTTDTDRVADVNISTLQLLNRNKRLLNMLVNEISFVIVDEAHLISVGALTNVFLKFPAYYRLGLSATPTRSDGLTAVLYDHFSFNVVESDNPNNLSIYHILVQHPSVIYYASMYDANKAWKSLYLSPAVMNDTFNLSLLLKREKKRNILIYATIVEQQEMYKLLLESEGYSVGVINGQTKKSIRTKYLNDFKEGRLDFLVSGVILQKGITLPNLDTIINVANHTKESFEQMVGRVRSLDSNKKAPIIFHFGFQGKGYYKAHNIKVWCNKLSKVSNDKVTHWDFKKFKSFLKGEENV